MQGGGPGFKSQWVHVSWPFRTGPLKCGTAFGWYTNDRCTTPRQAWVGRVDARTVYTTSGVYMTPCVRAIQASTGLVHRVTVTLHLLSRCERCNRFDGCTSSCNFIVAHIATAFRSCKHSNSFELHTSWLLCQLVDSSARKPMKDVPSCDKPEGAARRLRTQDLLMGTPHRNCFAQWGTPGTETS